MTPWTVAHPAPLSGGFSRQEYWSGLPFPSPRDLPDSGIKPTSPGMTGRFFTTEPPGKLSEIEIHTKKMKLDDTKKQILETLNKSLINHYLELVTPELSSNLKQSNHFLFQSQLLHSCLGILTIKLITNYRSFPL